MTRDRFQSAMTMDSFVAVAQKNAEFWQAAWRLARVDAGVGEGEGGGGAIDRARRIPGRWHLLALAEHWCVDAASMLPALGRFCEAVDDLEFRVLARDANPDLMDAHLTRGTRSIPVVIVYDEGFAEVGWWGPRPAELQQWFYDVGKDTERAERGRYLRSWYARDAGRTTVGEVLDVLERAAVGGAHSTTAGEES